MATPTPEAIAAATKAGLAHRFSDQLQRCACGWFPARTGNITPEMAEHWAGAMLAAAAPHMEAQAKAEVFPLIRDLADPDECWFDHNGACQAHGYYSIKPGETCPQHDAKVWLSMYAEETGAKTDD